MKYKILCWRNHELFPIDDERLYDSSEEAQAIINKFHHDSLITPRSTFYCEIIEVKE
jgi:hypothetical protein